MYLLRRNGKGDVQLCITDTRRYNCGHRHNACSNGVHSEQRLRGNQQVLRRTYDHLNLLYFLRISRVTVGADVAVALPSHDIFAAGPTFRAQVHISKVPADLSLASLLLEFSPANGAHVLAPPPKPKLSTSLEENA